MARRRRSEAQTRLLESVMELLTLERKRTKRQAHSHIVRERELGTSRAAMAANRRVE